MDAIPLALRRLVRRLESIEDLSRNDLIAILFLVRLGDNLHRAFYATFLTVSLIHQLAEKLNLGDDLRLEVEVNRTRWNFRQGTVVVAHEIAFDYDMETVSVLSKIGWSVLDGKMAPIEGLRLIRDHEVKITNPNKCRFNKGKNKTRIESFYIHYPGRALIVPLMGATCAAVYFDGTWHDTAFASVCGVAGGIVAWTSALNDQIKAVADYLAAICIAMIAVASTQAFPDSTCISAQVLGTLYWFLYGIAYVSSIYEITNNQLTTGVARLAAAIVRSYGLAFGVVLGVWFSAYDDDRWEKLNDSCTSKTNQISDYWYLLLFPLSGVACLMQFRVKFSQFGVCLVVQSIAYGSQYVIGTVWGQPQFIANMVPAFLTTIASHICISLAYRLKISGLKVGNDAYITKKTDEEQPPLPHQSHNRGPFLDDQVPSSFEGQQQLQPEEEGTNSDNSISFLNTGWDSQEEGGYTRIDKLAYARSDLWFCLLPALYLLVPGSKLFSTAFTVFLEVDDEDVLKAPSQLSSLGASLIVIGLGQVVGLRIGFAALWLWHTIWTWVECRCCNKKPEDVAKPVL